MTHCISKFESHLYVNGGPLVSENWRPPGGPLVTSLFLPISGFDGTSHVLWYCIVSIHLYSASCSAYESEFPVRETQREKRMLTPTQISACAQRQHDQVGGILEKEHRFCSDISCMPHSPH